MDPEADRSAGTPTVHVCPQCSRRFARPCDLNKHSKSHTRPHKCREPSCKYSTIGWPTAKELERHHNDKHSATPRTFRCQFQQCNYSSKRESNCKQHMEKIHNWEYVKSKSKGRRSTAQPKPDDGPRGSENVAVAAVDVNHTRPALTTSQSPATALTTGSDFLLFGDQEDAPGEDDNPHYPQLESAAESYLPWTSPATRMRDNELMIEKFSQTYNSVQGNANAIPNSHSAGMNHVLTGIALPGAQYYPQGGDGVNADAVAVKVEPPVLTLDTASPVKRKRPLFDDHLPQRNPTLASTQVREPHGAREAGTGQTSSISLGYHTPFKRGDGDDENGSRSKKPKLDPTQDFTDTNMPDIFRYAHPNIYDRNQSDKYSPCHTVHKEISTLVRHLGRPAHRLGVTERAISSFDVEDPNFRHQRAGVCRSCWQTFYKRSDFDNHVSSPCQKVSKGKKEKWRVLFDSFAPLAAGPTSQIGELNCPLPGQPDDPLSSAEKGDQEAARTPSTSVPSPVSPQLGTVVTGGRRFVSVDEHDRLRREHEALRQKFERVTHALLIKHLFQQTTAAGPAVKPPLPIASSEEGRPPNSVAAFDRDNLVQHMNSQPTDVDRHAFMADVEDTRRSLSRMNSGLSTTSRSTIHRVPPSPPSRPADLPHFPSDKGETDGHEKDGPAPGSPLLSIPDSGYGTDKRRGSLGDLAAGVGEQQAMPGLVMPSCTAETTIAAAATAAGGDCNKDKVGGETVTWGENPFKQLPRADNRTPSPPHQSQPSFMTYQMSDDADYSYYNMFYPENTLQSGSPTGFTFETNSQVE